MSNNPKCRALVQCSVHQIESLTMLSLEICQVHEPDPGCRGQLWQNWAQTISASNVKQWQRWFLKLSVSQKPKFQCHFLLLVELNYRTRLDYGFPVSPKQQEVRLGRGRMLLLPQWLVKTLKLRCMQACKCFIFVCLFWDEVSRYSLSLFQTQRNPPQLAKSYSYRQGHLTWIWKYFLT